MARAARSFSKASVAPCGRFVVSGAVVGQSSDNDGTYHIIHQTDGFPMT